MRPRSTSACVTTYDPVHVNVPPGATGCPTVGHVTPNAEPALSSTTRISDNVTSPVFVTTNEYDTRSPARATVAGVPLFTTDNPGPTANARSTTGTTTNAAATTTTANAPTTPLPHNDRDSPL